MRPRVHVDQACTCPSPLPSGMLYLGRESCRLCGNYVVSEYHLSRLQRESERRRLEQAVRDRQRVKGGLEPDGGRRRWG